VAIQKKEDTTEKEMNGWVPLTVKLPTSCGPTYLDANLEWLKKDLDRRKIPWKVDPPDSRHQIQLYIPESYFQQPLDEVGLREIGYKHFKCL